MQVAGVPCIDPLTCTNVQWSLQQLAALQNAGLPTLDDQVNPINSRQHNCCPQRLRVPARRVQIGHRTQWLCDFNLVRLRGKKRDIHKLKPRNERHSSIKPRVHRYQPECKLVIKAKLKDPNYKREYSKPECYWSERWHTQQLVCQSPQDAILLLHPQLVLDPSGSIFPFPLPSWPRRDFRNKL